MGRDASRPDAFRRSRRAGRVKSAASFTRRERSRTEPRAARRSGRAGGAADGARAREHGEYGEHPPFDAPEHRGTFLPEVVEVLDI
jgi:hypothetical protein